MANNYLNFFDTGQRKIDNYHIVFSCYWLLYTDLLLSPVSELQLVERDPLSPIRPQQADVAEGIGPPLSKVGLATSQPFLACSRYYL